MVRSLGNDPGRRVLNDLEFIEEFGGKAREDSIAVVYKGCYKCMTQNVSAGLRQGWAESG